MTPQEWLAALRAEARDTVDLLGNGRRRERERMVCAAFLRCAGIAFTPDQLISSPTEPPDVLFDRARFEVAIELAPGRRMHEEWRTTVETREAAEGMQDLIVPYEPPQVLTRQEAVDLITPIATRKEENYRERGIVRDDLDLLVYVNQNVILDVDCPSPQFALFRQQEWRSVSILVPPYSYVVYVSTAAPAVLLERVGNPTAAWTRPGMTGLFEI